jgi:hypothetical protein
VSAPVGELHAVSAGAAIVTVTAAQESFFFMASFHGEKRRGGGMCSHGLGGAETMAVRCRAAVRRVLGLCQRSASTEASGPL